MIRLYQQKAYAELELALSEFLQRFPRSTEGWILKGNLSLQLSKTGAARKAFTRALALDDADDRPLLGLGVVARREGRYDLAEDYYYRVLKSNPASHTAKSNLLIVEILNGSLDTAVSLGEDAWRGADKREPGQLAIGANLAIAYHESGREKEAGRLLRQLKDLNYQGAPYLQMYLEGNISLQEII